MNQIPKTVATVVITKEQLQEVLIEENYGFRQTRRRCNKGDLKCLNGALKRVLALFNRVQYDVSIKRLEHGDTVTYTLTYPAPKEVTKEIFLSEVQETLNA